MVTVQPATKADLEDALRHYATKEDLAKLETRLTQALMGATRWNVVIMALLGGTAIAILRLT